jgi:hypothetical protein
MFDLRRRIVVSIIKPNKQASGVGGGFAGFFTLLEPRGQYRSATVIPIDLNYED